MAYVNKSVRYLVGGCTLELISLEFREFKYSNSQVSDVLQVGSFETKLINLVTTFVRNQHTCHCL
jgi:hypothetical protein